MIVASESNEEEEEDKQIGSHFFLLCCGTNGPRDLIVIYIYMNFLDMIRHCKVVERVVRAPIERWLDHVLYFCLVGVIESL